MPLRGLIGSDVQKNRADWKVGENPFAPDGTKDPIVFLPAIRPDVALFHATKADREGNVWIGRRRELVTMAHAAKQTIVTVEEVVDGSLLADEATAAGVLPSIYVSAVAEAKNGARPLGLQDLYAVDDAAIARYAEAARTETGFRDWLAGFMDGRKAAALAAAQTLASITVTARPDSVRSSFVAWTTSADSFVSRIVARPQRSSHRPSSAVSVASSSSTRL